jgi:NAD(P)-dependent dehydrogenase (short-subunit alcohol dehydrogenase family)
VVTYPCDVTDEAGIAIIAKEIGQWDVLILNAGNIATPMPVGKGDLDEWWKTFEVSSSLPIDKVEDGASLQGFIPIRVVSLNFYCNSPSQARFAFRLS